MKKSLFIMLFVLSNIVTANANSEGCEIYSNAHFRSPQVGQAYDYDWSTQSYLDKEFLELGYEGIGSAKLEDMNEGDLFTRVVTVNGGRKNHWRGGSRIFSYTIIQLRQKDSKEKDGYKILDRGNSNQNTPYQPTIQGSLATSFKEALRNIKSCRRLKIDMRRNKTK